MSQGKIRPMYQGDYLDVPMKHQDLVQKIFGMRRRMFFQDCLGHRDPNSEIEMGLWDSFCSLGEGS